MWRELPLDFDCQNNTRTMGKGESGCRSER